MKMAYALFRNFKDNFMHVVKKGSDLMANQAGIDHESIRQYAHDWRDTDELIFVTSGAVATGRTIYREMAKGELEDNRQNLKYLAGLGCTAMFAAIEDAFRDEGRLVASYPITHSQLEADSGFVDTLRFNAQMRTISVINEADAISQQELMKVLTGGENDGLACHIARAVKACKLTIFTKKGGIRDEEGKLIEYIDQNNHDQVRLMLKARSEAGNAKSRNGKGGILTKFDASYEAALGGIEARISGVGNGTKGINTTRFMVG